MLLPKSWVSLKLWSWMNLEISDAQDIHKPRLGSWVEPTVSVTWIKPEYIFTWFSCPEILLDNDTGVQFRM